MYGAPNILFMLIDDLGWNDIGFHDGCDYTTPNIDSLQREALTLNNYYVDKAIEFQLKNSYYRALKITIMYIY